MFHFSFPVEIKLTPFKKKIQKRHCQVSFIMSSQRSKIVKTLDIMLLDVKGQVIIYNCYIFLRAVT